MEGVACGVPVVEGEEEGVRVPLGVGVGLCVEEGDPLGVGVCERVDDPVWLPVCVSVAVADAEAVEDGDPVAVGVVVRVSLGVGVVELVPLEDGVPVRL